MSSIQHQGEVLDLDLGATIRSPLYDCPFTRGLLSCPFSYFGPFLGLEVLGGDDLSLLYYVLAFLIPLSFLVRKLKQGSVDGKRSRRSSLDGHLGHRPSCVGLEEL